MAVDVEKQVYNDVQNHEASGNKPESICLVSEAVVHVRMSFIRKVYCILVVQLILISSVGCITLFTPIARFYVNENSWLLTVAFLSYTVLLVVLFTKRRHYPVNCMVLAVFTVAESFSVAVFVSYYDQLAVLQAFILSALATILLMICTFRRKSDLSFLFLGVVTCLCILVAAGFLQMFLGSTNNEALLSAGISLVVCWYILYDTREIISRLTPSEFLIGSIDLHTDIPKYFFQFLYSMFVVRKKHY